MRICKRKKKYKLNKLDHRLEATEIRDEMA